MIPIQLTIEGLYSYQTRQTIDFTNLIDACLFGIFGAVGSGKSSILEAISYALYGETERLNSKDKRSYNMMNLKSNRSYIEFDFTNFENRIFRTTREFKRNSKRFEDVKTQTAVFYEKIADQWVPLEHTNAETLIGLSYMNFKRTIIIPQGQFKEFIDLGATDRTRMMKEIFSLQRYDLQDNVKRIFGKNSNELAQIEGQLKGFEEVSGDILEEQKQLFQTEELAFKDTSSAYKIELEAFQRLKNIKTDFQNLALKQQQLVGLEDEEKRIKNLDKELAIYEKVNQAFRPLFDAHSKEKASGIQMQLEMEKQQQIFQKTQEERVALEEVIEKTKHLVTQLPEKRKDENDLNQIAQIISFQKQVSELQARTKKGNEAVVEKTDEQKILKKKIDSQLRLLEEKKQQRIDSTILMEVNNWFMEKKSIEKELLQQQKLENEYQKKRQYILDDLILLTPDIPNWEPMVEQELNLLKKAVDEFQKEKNSVEVAQQLSEYAHHLHEGEACPLCGALSHPDRLIAQDFSKDIERITNRIKEIEEQIELVQKKKLRIEQLLQSNEETERVLADNKKELAVMNKQLVNFKSQFNWPMFEPENEALFLEKKQKATLLEHEIKEEEVAIEKLRKTLEQVTTDLDKFKEALKGFELDEAKITTAIQTHEQQLNRLKLKDYELFSADEINHLLEKTNAENNKIEEDFTAYNTQYIALTQEFSEQKNSVNTTKKRIEEHHVSLQLVDKQINELQTQLSFGSRNEIQKILDQQLMVEEIRQEIQEFTIRRETLKNSISELSERLKDQEFSDELFQQKEIALNHKAIALKQSTEKVAQLSAEINRLTMLFEQKKEILLQQTHLLKRADNLKTMKNLFDQSGFVKYVSSIYLKQLCDNANVRFHRMTRNQLSLQLNDNTEFEVIDYLNEGRSRSVKTLSGGQSFQVSLSLALALAESVQSDSKAQRNFFFIDEGFGTQDAEAVNIVFETLTHLQKENRIVGIISHVEDLQERMPISLTIQKDEEKGSYVAEQRM